MLEVLFRAFERPHDPAAPFSALVFKTVIDPFAGKLSIMRVMSGRATTDANVLNSTRGVREHFGHLLRLDLQPAVRRPTELRSLRQRLPRGRGL